MFPGHMILPSQQPVLREAASLVCFPTVCPELSRMMDSETSQTESELLREDTDGHGAAAFQGCDESGGLKETTDLSLTG